MCAVVRTPRVKPCQATSASDIYLSVLLRKAAPREISVSVPSGGVAAMQKKGLELIHPHRARESARRAVRVRLGQIASISRRGLNPASEALMGVAAGAVRGLRGLRRSSAKR